MTQTLPDGYVVHLPPPKRIPHALGPEVRIAPKDSISGHEQIERTCKACGAVKITIIDCGGDHRRAWRRSADAAQVETDVAIVCVPFDQKP